MKPPESKSSETENSLDPTDLTARDFKLLGVSAFLFFIVSPVCLVMKWLAPNLLSDFGISPTVLGRGSLVVSLGIITIICWLKGSKYILREADVRSFKGWFSALGWLLLFAILCIAGLIGSFSGN